MKVGVLVSEPSPVSPVTPSEPNWVSGMKYSDGDELMFVHAGRASLFADDELRLGVGIHREQRQLQRHDDAGLVPGITQREAVVRSRAVVDLADEVILVRRLGHLRAVTADRTGLHACA